MRGSGLVLGFATCIQPNHSTFSVFCAVTYPAIKAIHTKNTVTKTEVVAFLSFMECLLSRGGVLYTFTHSSGNETFLHKIHLHDGAVCHTFTLSLTTSPVTA